MQKWKIKEEDMKKKEKMQSFDVHDAADPAAEAALRNGEDMLIRLRWRGGDEREKLEQWAALFTTWPPGT